MKKVNNTLNLLKGLACMGVVFIHVNFPGELGQIVIALSRSAVALFFPYIRLLSLLGRSERDRRKDAEKLKNIGLIAIWAFIFYFCGKALFAFGAVDGRASPIGTSMICLLGKAWLNLCC